MDGVVAAALVLLAVDSVTTALLAVVLRRSGYRVRVWPEKKPPYYA